MRHHLQAFDGALQALHARVVGVPVVIYIVLVFIGSGYPEQHILLSGFRERDSLAPETADGDHHFQTVVGDIFFVACYPRKLHDGIHDDVVAVYLFECDFPFVVALFSMDSHHRIEGGSAAESQFACVFDGFGQLVVTI